MSIVDTTNALDVNALNDMRRSVEAGTPGANHKVAQQFEGLFLSMVLKNMRAALPQGDPLENDEVKMATSMFDNQIAQNLAAGKGIGLASALEKQMDRAKGSAIAPGTGVTPIALKPAAQAALPLRAIDEAGRSYHRAASVRVGQKPPTVPSAIHANFVDKYKSAAIAASQASGIPAKVILGQAALESGWGKHEARDANGNGSHNLFGIKAGASWTGPTVESVTTEYINGVAQKVVQKFRAYASDAESFMDYAKMIANSPRYAHVMQLAHDAVAFAAGIAHSGYATDPNYGQKLAQVINGPLRHLV